MVRSVRRLALLAIAGGLIASLAGAPGAAAAPGASAAVGIALPARVYAPYFEMWTSGKMQDVAQASGARYLTLAFLSTTGKSSCTLAWNGSKSQTVASGAFLADIKAVRALGGDVIPSLGGWSADQGGTEVGDSCATATQITAAYAQLVQTYGVSRIDMDIEGRSLTKTANITRRNQAIKALQDWAAAAGTPLTIQYTLPTTRAGLAASGLAVLQDAVAQGVHLDLVNPMAFDYGDGSKTAMGDSAISALNGVHGQLKSLLPGWTDAAVWAIQGVTIMNGVDDVARRAEITYVADATKIRDFALKNGMSAYSMWAIQRDNGNCTSGGGSSSCSGIAQELYEFTANLKDFITPPAP